MRRLPAAILIAVASFALVLLLHAAGLLERLELIALDLRYASGLGRKPAGSDIVVAWIDQESMDWLDKQDVPFPWPRSVYGQAMDYVLGGGARAVAFDVLFDQRGTASDDREFADALTRARGDVLAMKFMASRTGARTPAENERFARRGVALAGELPRRAPEPGVALPLPEFEQGADRLGFVNIRPDADKVYRRYDLLRLCAPPGSNEPAAYPSLGLAAVLAARGAAGVRRDPDGALAVDVPGGAPVAAPVAAGADARMLLNFRGPEFTFEHVKFVNILESINRVEQHQEPLYPAARFKDKIVLVGINAEGYEDAHPTPLSRVFPGVELHATAIDNLLRGDALAAPGCDLPLAAAAAAAGTAAVFLLPGVTAPLLALAALLLAFAAATVWSWLGLLVLPVAAPALGGALAAGGAFLWRLVVEGRQRRELGRAFASYLAPEVMAKVLADPAAVALGGQQREVTVLFTDLQGFTALGEVTSPPELVRFLNDYFTDMCAPILQEHGVIDKFIGDAIMALFGAPLDAPDHAARAVRAALAATAVSERIASDLRAAGRPVVRTRIGVHSGAAVVGNMGSRQRFDYTAIGDTVNLASRLEGANKTFGTGCLVSEATWAGVGDAVLGREVGLIAVLGRQAPIRVHEPLALRELADERQRALAQQHEDALVALRQGDRGAAARAFAALHVARPEDALAALYQERLAAPGWDGVFRLDAK
jgi:adenylate cyclase